MITWRTQVYSSQWQYRTARYDTLLKVEEKNGTPQTRPYVDNQVNPAPTIGVGFNLRVPENLNEILIAMGFDPDEPDIGESDYIERIRTAVNRGYASGDNDALRKNLDQVMKDWSEDARLSTHNDKPKRATFTLYTGEVRTVFDILAPRYEDQLTNWAGDTGLGTIPDSPERIALLSLVWNSKDVNPRDGIPDLLGPNLTKAIQTGNRAEAWYEIRYNTNAEGEAGVAKRRYYESELFGLYNDAGGQSPAEREADYLEVLRMYTRHRTAIVAGENRYGETATVNPVIA